MIFTGLDSIPNDRVCSALMGLSKAKFIQLHQAFAAALGELQQEAYAQGYRQRHAGGGQVGNLATTEHKLFFLLFYLKTYPTLDVLGYQFGFNASHACRHLQALYPVLERALSRLDVLPNAPSRPLKNSGNTLAIIRIYSSMRPNASVHPEKRSKGRITVAKKRHTVP